MPSPFPGMDPYLEHPEFFPDLHDTLIVELRNTLQATLPPPYYSMINRRFWIVLEEELQTFVEIHTTQGDRPVVTAIEILSPGNKASGATGRERYVQKQREYLACRVHLVEIDLLRGGTHATAVPLEQAIAAAGPFDYHVCARRHHEPGKATVYPIRLEQRLPQIAIPLLANDPDVTLDLQTLLDRCYDTGPYQRQSPYSGWTLDPALTAEQQEWATALLRERGLNA